MAILNRSTAHEPLPALAHERRVVNVAARAGRWSAAHSKQATFGWLLFAIAFVTLGTAVGTRSQTQADYASGEAGTAERILQDSGFQQPASESVLVQNRSLSAGDPRFASVIAQVVRTVSADPHVTNVQDPLRSRVAQISRDGHSALVQFDMKGDRDKAKDLVQPIMDAMSRVQRAHPDFRVEEFGFASANHVVGQTINQDFARAEQLSLPITLVILLLAFGALVAAGIPVLLAFSAVLAAIGIDTVISHLLPASDATKSVILLVGMAVGVDYSLFYLRREREERARGAEPHTALLRSAGTSGQAVLVSGATVLIAMAGMFLAGNNIFTSIGLGTMIVVFVAIVGSLSVLPALLHRLGDRVEKGRVPVVGRRRRPAGESRMWAAILRPVLRHPAVAVVLSVGTLAAAAVPLFGMHTKLPSFTDLPHDLPIVSSYQHVQQAFPGAQTPVRSWSRRAT